MSVEKKEKTIENGSEFREFMVSQGLEDYSKIPVEKVKFSPRIKIAFWFLRVYIVIMVLLVIIGFSHVI